MIAVTQSALLHALGYAIVNSVWQFGLLWLVYLLVQALPAVNAHKKYAAAIAMQLAGFAWFVLTFIFYYGQYLQIAPVSAGTKAVSYTTLAVDGKLADWLMWALVTTEQYLPYLSIAYMLVLLVLASRWVQSLLTIHTLKKEGLQRMEVDYRLFVDRISHQLGIKKRVTVFLSSLAKSPLTLGWMKPVILIPAASLTYLTPDQLEAVLVHELAHIRRHDYLLNLVMSVIEVALFFNPFMQLLSRQAASERENCCDDWVLQYNYNAGNYAHALLKIATVQQRGLQAALAMNAVDENKHLLSRVKRMLNKQHRTVQYRNQVLALALLSILMFSIAWVRPRQTSQPLQNMAQETVILEPLAAKVENPFFNPAFFLAKKRIEQLQHEAAKTASGRPVKRVSMPVLNFEPLPPVSVEAGEAPEPVEPAAPVHAAPKNVAFASSFGFSDSLLFTTAEAAFKAVATDLKKAENTTWKFLNSGQQVFVAAQKMGENNELKLAREKRQAQQEHTNLQRQASAALHKMERVHLQGVAASRKADDMRTQALEKAELHIKKAYQHVAEQVNNHIVRVGAAQGEGAISMFIHAKNSKPGHVFSYDYVDQPAKATAPSETSAARSIAAPRVQAAQKDTSNHADFPTIIIELQDGKVLKITRI